MVVNVVVWLNLRLLSSCIGNTSLISGYLNLPKVYEETIIQYQYHPILVDFMHYEKHIKFFNPPDRGL